MPDIFAWNVVTVVAVVVAWPLSVPLMALAYKAQYGYKPVPIEPREFWLRSLGGGVGLAALSTLLLGVGFLLVHEAEIPVWFTYLVVVAVYVPVGVWLVYWMFACEDLQDALGLYFVAALLSGVVFTPICLILRFVLMRHAGA